MINDLQLKDNIIEKDFGQFQSFFKVTINHQIYDAIPNLRTGSRRDIGLSPFNSGPLDLSNITRSRS